MLHIARGMIAMQIDKVQLFALSTPQNDTVTVTLQIKRLLRSLQVVVVIVVGRN